MRSQGVEPPRPFVTSAFALLICAVLLAPPPLSAGEEGRADEPTQHHHRMPAPGFERTEATYVVPAVDLVDQHGNRQPLAQLLSTEKPVILNFIFTTCAAICPVMSGTFEQVQQLGDDADTVLMVSVSIDPEQDTPTALAVYAKRFHAGPQRLFLTGRLDDSIAVQKAFGAYRGDKTSHAPLTLLRAGADAPWVRYDGFAGAADLTKEVRAMPTETAEPPTALSTDQDQVNYSVGYNFG